MACRPTPTLTRTDIVTSNNLVTSFTSSVSTSPPTVTSSVSRGCAAPLPSGTCTIPDVTVPVTIPGSVTTIQVPVVVTVPATATQITTLFGSNCDNTNTPVVTPVLTQTTPPPVVFTSQMSSTMADGSVVVQFITTTSTLPASAVYVSTTVPGASSKISSSPNRSSANLAPVIGGVVGGFFGLIGIVLLIWFILKRRRRWDDIFERDDDLRHRNRFSLDVDVEPKPYQYGLVGHAPAPPLISPPNSPPLTATTPLNNGSSAAYSAHGQRRSSLTPLNLSASVSTPGPSTAAHSSRPSTAGSNQPLWPGSRQGTGQHAQRPSSSYTVGRSESITSPPLGLANWNSGPNFNVGPVGAGAVDAPYNNRSGTPDIQEQPQPRLLIVNGTPVASTGDLTAHRSGPSLDSGEGSLPGVNSGPSGARDGKGRPLRNSSAQGVLVHVDGGRLAGTAGGSSAPAEPPAYEA